MTEILNILKQVEEWPLTLTVIVALNAVGYSLKMASFFPNRFIPMTLLALGGWVWWAVGDIEPLKGNRHPEIGLIIYGMVLSCMSVGLHRIAKRMGLEKFLPFLGSDKDVEEEGPDNSNKPKV